MDFSDNQGAAFEKVEEPYFISLYCFDYLKDADENLKLLLAGT